MAISYFTVVGKFSAVISDGADAGNEPDTQDVSALVTFTPSIREARVDIAGTPTQISLTPILGRIEDDGILKVLDGTVGVKLLGGDAAEGDPLFGLSYAVSFSKVVYNKARDQKISPFSFVAPTDGSIVNLATVERV